MHVHSHMHGASPVRNQDASATNARSATSSATPFSVTADGDGNTASADAAAFGNDQGGSNPATSFASLSNNIQALLLGVGQNGQTGSTPAASALQAYQASNQNGLFA